MMWVAIATAAMSAYSSIQQGNQEKKFYGQQADQARLQGRVQAVQYEQQANRMLKSSIETQAMARARAAAGGVDPFSGSAQFVQDLSAQEGLADFNTMQDNAALSRISAATQSTNYEDAGRYARKRGLLGAATAIGQGVYRYGRLGGPTKTEFTE
jgi:cell fate (sporulation/competence/biofilm development) regulator YlbF (YheA/YmcA/DUF963 family)